MRQKVVYLKEAHWKKIEPLLPKGRRFGRPRAKLKSVVEGIMWVLTTGARWKDLPERYPSPSTCWRYLKGWEEQGVWLRIMLAFLYELNEQGRLVFGDTFLDGSFASAKKGGPVLAKPKGAKAQN